MDSFEENTKSFISWLGQLGVRMNSKMALVDLRAEGRGRGVVATGDFEEEEVIFTIPRSAVLNIENITNFKVNTLEGLPSWLALMAIMIRESQCNSSKWAPYFEILPRQLDSLIFWSDSELLELQASTVVKKIGKSSAEELFRENAILLGSTDTDLCHRVASIIMAYAFDIPDTLNEAVVDGNEDDGDDLVSENGEDEKIILSMVPLADLLNADGDKNNARLSCDNGDLEMRAIKPIGRGEEILNDYGQLPRADLLRRYGYVTDQYTIYDVAEISTENIIAAFRSGTTFSDFPFLPLDKADLDRRIEIAERENVFEDSYDIAHAGSDMLCIPDELLALLYLLLLDKDNLMPILNAQRAIPSRSKLATELVGRVLTRLLQLRESEYKTTIEEDEETLRSSNLAPRIRMALEVRVGEKRILREAMTEATSFVGDNKRMREEQKKASSGLERKRNAGETNNVAKKKSRLR